jgi:hypothetical protein
MRSLTISTIILSITAGLFVLNRFYDMLPHSDPSTLVIILFYSFLPAILLLLGLALLYRKKIAGLWLMIICCCYLLVRHSLMYRSLRFRQQTFATPEHIAQRFTIQHIDVIFAIELATVIATLYLLARNKKRLMA